MILKKMPKYSDELLNAIKYFDSDLLILFLRFLRNDQINILVILFHQVLFAGKFF